MDDKPGDVLSEGLNATSSVRNETKKRKASRSKMARVIEGWINNLPTDALQGLDLSTEKLLDSFPTAYAIYQPMLLWPKGTVTSGPWQLLISRMGEPQLHGLYEKVAEEFHVRCIAINGGIPLQGGADGQKTNILRSPSKLRPVHGDFGPVVTTAPTPADFEAALWVETRQNNIRQCWAPLYTMFSQGNVTEKARVLHLPALGPAVMRAEDSTAVDLYAGIGYFAFSYAKAGVGLVLCWELNPWSVEGLRRGARANGWRAALFRCDYVGERTLEGRDVHRENLVVFEEDNENARRRISKARAQIPPVRHVNCGMLPTSAPVWDDAVAIVDPDQGRDLGVISAIRCAS
ncbi:MAG: hypothetical protein M1838_003891 [Thelocarpon superellum]|nr:MAG: hypothetical protein M1838_003891 [Thelocarpon superellum]